MSLGAKETNTSPSRQAGDAASAMVTVAVTPSRAFEIFTAEINLWWRRGPRFRNAPGDRGVIAVEPGVGGRVFESFSATVGEPGSVAMSGFLAADYVVELGRVKIWNPPSRLVLEWRNINFAPAEKTEVEVQFMPCPSGTRITVIHRGWNQLRRDHPVRHGLPTVEFISMMGRWWGDQLTALREFSTP